MSAKNMKKKKRETTFQKSKFLNFLVGKNAESHKYNIENSSYFLIFNDALHFGRLF